MQLIVRQVGHLLNIFRINVCVVRVRKGVCVSLTEELRNVTKRNIFCARLGSNHPFTNSEEYCEKVVTCW